MTPQLTVYNARWRAGRIIAIAVAAAATAVAWLGGRLAHVDYIVDTPFGTRQITLALSVAATVVAGLVGWAVIVLLERYTASPRRIWVALALVVLLLSIVPVFRTPANLATQLMLSVLHCVAATVLIPGLTRRRS